VAYLLRQSDPISNRCHEETVMPALASPSTDERTLLLGFLATQRQALKVSAYGLSDDDARTSAAASTLTVGGLIKHLTDMERNWMSMTRGDRQDRDASGYLDGFRVTPDETLEGLITDYDAAARETDALIGERRLDDAVPVPKGVPWFPADLDAWSVRWVIVHLIEETARHAGHADLVREAIDGATAFPLLAAAEGWPATPWLQPWAPVDAV
jgi:hypothetical protein